MRRKFVSAATIGLAIAFIPYLHGALKRSRLSTPIQVSHSPNGKWLMEAYSYPASHFWGGVVRIYDSENKIIEAEIDLNSYCFNESTYTIHDNIFIYCTEDGEESIYLPASWWTRLKAHLP